MYTMRVTPLAGEKIKLFWSCSSMGSSQCRGSSPVFQFSSVMSAKVSGGSSKRPFISVQGLVELLKRVMRPPMECPTMTMLFISLESPRGLYSCMSSSRAFRCLLAGMVQAQAGRIAEEPELVVFPDDGIHQKAVGQVGKGGGADIRPWVKTTGIFRGS